MEAILGKAIRRYVGRLAPSPTGALHLGNVRTFMIAWLRARSQGGKVILRMEDLDHPKDKPGAAAEAIRDLKWLGFDWDEEYVQSERKDIYKDALAALGDVVYPCVCTRKDVESAQSAPHEGEQLYYPGICRGRFDSWHAAYEFKGAAPCWRFRTTPQMKVEFDDVFVGHYSQNISSVLGDFPVARDEFGAGYTLACIVDDMLMGVTEVIRGDDLLAATPAQVLIARRLVEVGFRDLRESDIPRFCHVPLVVGRDGRRLAKRHGDTRIATFREEGMSPKQIMGKLAASCGWVNIGSEMTLSELIPFFDIATIPHSPFMI